MLLLSSHHFAVYWLQCCVLAVRLCTGGLLCTNAMLCTNGGLSRVSVQAIM